MTTTNQPHAIRKLMTILLIACMCASVLLSGSAQANLNPTKGKATPAATQYPNLRRFGSNLTRLARLGKLQNVDGYDAEIASVVESLATSNAAPVLVGESTLQRSAIVRGLALRIAAGDVPASLRNKQIFSLSLDALADGAKTSREFESRVQAIVAETATANGNIVLFLDELQEYAGKRATNASSGALQTALRQNGLQVIGAASPAAYDEYIASDQTLAGLFKALRIGEIEATATASNGEIEASPRAQGFEGDKISPDMRELMQSASGDGTVTAILQVSDVRSSQLRSLLKRHGVVVSGQMSELGALKVQLPVKAVEELAASGLTNYVSPDVTLESFGHVTNTTGTEQNRSLSSLLGLVTTSKLDGTGVGIAILDSGVDTGHRNFSSNIKLNKDFTNENKSTIDPYGHGTHVASTASGSSNSNGNSYDGIAPAASIINLRVLNSQGVGSTSVLLNALNWILSPADPTRPVSSTNPRNKDKYNIDIVNLSLGAPAISSYKNDPICRAARALVDAGIVVVAAAGNNGKMANGTKIYGQIHAPGNEPSVITVGAANSFGTDSRADDVVASYSSRGPTRSSFTDESGVKHYDNLLKPDLVAPGNKLIYAESDVTLSSGLLGLGGSSSVNLLVSQHPELDSGIRDDDNRRLMYLSGSSMATPVVAGAAALMLQVNPKLTPNMIKMILMYTTQPIAGYNMLEQGTGQVNVDGAVKLAKLVRTDLNANTAPGSPMLTGNAPAPQSTIAGRTFSWSRGVFFPHHYATGSSLITRYQSYYGLGKVLGDGIVLGDGDVLGEGIVLGDNVVMPDGIVLGDTIWTSAGVFLGDGTMFCSGLVLSDGIVLGDNVFLGDGIVLGDNVFLGDGIVLGDNTVIGEGIVLGDFTVQAMSATIGGDPGPQMY